MAGPKQMLERVAKLAEVLSGMSPRDDVLSAYITDWNIRIHVEWETFRRLFGGQQVRYHNGAWVAKQDGVEWAAHEPKVNGDAVEEERICPPLRELETANV